MFSCALRSLPTILIDIGPIPLSNGLPTVTNRFHLAPRTAINLPSEALLGPRTADRCSRSEVPDATLIRIVYRYPIILYLISTKPKVLKE